MPSESNDEREARIGQIVSGYIERRLRGAAESEAELLARYPELADELRLHLGTLKELQPVSGQVESLIAQGVLRPAADPRYLAQLGAYQITGLLGRGGMGVVLKAYEESLNRTVALKLLRPELADDTTAVVRFAREAKAAGALRHPHIVTVHAVGRAGETHFLAMEYVDGPTLGEVIRKHGPLPAEVTRLIFRQVLSGLAAAHNAGLIHRDIKPANILLDRDPLQDGSLKVEGQRSKVGGSASGVATPTAKIADFGVALMGSAQTRLTLGDSALGTPDYMSPEQARGDAGIDSRADLYSAGAVLFEMLTGRPPFRAETPTAVIHQILHVDPPRPGSIHMAADSHLASLATRLLAKRPEDRFDGADATLDALIARTRVRSVEQTRRRRTVGSLLVFGTLIVGMMWYLSRDTNLSAPVLNGVSRVEGFPDKIQATYGDELDPRLFFKFPEPVQVVDVQLVEAGPGKRQIVVAGIQPPIDGHCLFAWDPAGRELWRRDLSSARRWPDDDTPGSFRCAALAVGDLDASLGQEVVVSANDSGQYMTRVVIVDPLTGEVETTFWHLGLIEGLAVVSDLLGEVGSRRSAVLAWGVNNKLDGFGDPPPRPYESEHVEDFPVTDWDIVPVVMILDPERMDGLGPPRTDRIELAPMRPVAYAFLDMPNRRSPSTLDRTKRDIALTATAAFQTARLDVRGQHRESILKLWLRHKGCEANWGVLTVGVNLEFISFIPNTEAGFSSQSRGDDSECSEITLTENELRARWHVLVRDGEFANQGP